MRKRPFLFLVLLFALPGYSQSSLSLQYPGGALFRSKHDPRRSLETVYTLPVVFHIIHRNGPENISDNEVLAVLDILNKGFANAGNFDQGSGVDTKINFCLAQTDPDGNYTTGINRVYADFPKVIPELPESEARFKSLVCWDTRRYINIWIIKEVDLWMEFNFCGYDDTEEAGYASMPRAHGNFGDGIVAEAAALPNIIIHEMGHYLGLYHTFEGFCTNNDCSTDGDRVCDTPPERTITSPCGKTENSCSTDVLSGFSTDQPDLTTNFMDYGNNACQHDFTQGQKDRMRSMIENYRSSLLTSGVCNNDCSQPAIAGFSFTEKEYKIGDTVFLINTSVSAAGYQWFINGQSLGTNTDISFVLQRQGFNKIELLVSASPDQPQCRNRKLSYIRAWCSVKPRITIDRKRVIAGDTLVFSSSVIRVKASAAPLLYKWYANDVLFGTGEIVRYSFSSPGKRKIYLVVTEGACADTSDLELVDIKPLPDYTLTFNAAECQAGNKNKVRFTLCNDGYFNAPPGIPVSFYYTNPTTTRAVLAGTIYTNDTIRRFCCDEFSFDVPNSYKGTLYGVVNDDHSRPAPYNFLIHFPVTGFRERNYTNNMDHIDLSAFGIAIIPADTTVRWETVVPFSTTAQPHAAKFQWKVDRGILGCDTCAATGLQVLGYTRVIVTVTDSLGCSYSDTAIVRILMQDDLAIPTAFTPNSDQLNDVFYVLGNESVTRIRSMMVFNRWGQKVFDRQNIFAGDPLQGWDGTYRGKRQSSAVFVYSITAEFTDGSIKRYKGTVTLIR